MLAKFAAPARLFALVLLAAGTAAAAGLGVATPEQFRTLPGFQVELVYEVPADEQGSWVSLTSDPAGRLIACDQNGGLYRIDLSGDKPEVEKLKIDVVGAQGLLCAFGSLYANVNHPSEPSGVWRLTDTDGDDQYDQREHILPLNAGGEHGPHAMIVTPDGERILVCAGNNTVLPDEITTSRVPQVWDEDHLLERMPDARGHNATRMAPGGFILSMNPAGGELDLIATGFRNEYDIALNRDGELFTYDADMEWDVGTPWYRPTRVNHVISGAEFGWRNGTGKWPAYYPDSFGAAVDIGPGSPTGICFGYGTNFPSQYENALFVADWSYGNIYVVQLRPDGSTYGGDFETFATAAPLPVTDLVVRPEDGCLYFTIGGRQTQSALYRIRYDGSTANDANQVAGEPTDPDAEKLRALRHKIESTYTNSPAQSKDSAGASQPSAQAAIELALKQLGHEDRGIRFAARIALEHQPVELWRERVLTMDDPQARVLGVIALARHGDESDRSAAFAALTELDWGSIPTGVRVDLLRALELVAIRLGRPTADERDSILAQIGDAFPASETPINRELAQLLVYLQVPQAVELILEQLESAPSQEDQIHYAMVLRSAKQGWTAERYRRYFDWFNRIQSARGGMSFGGFIENIKQAAIENLPNGVREQLAEVLKPVTNPTDVATEQRPFVQEWAVDDLLDPVAGSDTAPDFERGRTLFAAAQCYKCHRMGLQGGILGPDLTAAGGRFNTKDMLVSIIEPNRVISDQYGATQFITDDGRVIVGRVVNMNGRRLSVMTNMLDPSDLAQISHDAIESTSPSQISMMPTGLLNTLTAEEIADLIAYLTAGGNQNHPLYKAPVASN